MGGSIAVTIRDINGVEYRMCRWTNPLPNFINNPKLVTGDMNHLSEYIGQWNDMRQDFLEHRESGSFAFPMTDAYAPYPFLAPMGYGLLLVDYVSMSIISMQEYLTVGTIYIGLPDAIAQQSIEIFSGLGKVLDKTDAGGLEVYKIDLSPFKVISLDRHSSELGRMKELVVSLGFTLSEEELKMWDEFHSELKQQEED